MALQEDIVEFTEVAGDEAREALSAGVLAILDGAARELGRPFDPAPLHIAARDQAGALLGGLVGQEVQGWLFVKFLAVDGRQRGAGLGGRLLARAEAFADRRGLAGVYLDTFDFQAPAFYLKQGYREIGRLPSVAGTPERIWFAKALNAAETGR